MPMFVRAQIIRGDIETARKNAVKQLPESWQHYAECVQTGFYTDDNGTRWLEGYWRRTSVANMRTPL